jgi:hypothetical protein
MKITEAFDVLKQHGHVFDQYEFDNRWLGKQTGYFAYLKSTNNQPSIETLMRFHFRLIGKDKAYKQFELDTGELNEIANSVMGEIERRCV